MDISTLIVAILGIILYRNLDDLPIMAIQKWYLHNIINKIVFNSKVYLITPSSMTECDAIYFAYPKHSRQLVKIGVLVDFLLEQLGK